MSSIYVACGNVNVNGVYNPPDPYMGGWATWTKDGGGAQIRYTMPSDGSTNGPWEIINTANNLVLYSLDLTYLGEPNYGFQLPLNFFEGERREEE